MREVSNNKKERVKKIWAIWVVVLLILAVVIGGLIYYYISKGKEEEIKLSMIVVPDRVNVPMDKYEEYGYHLIAFSNDNVNFSVYLTNHKNVRLKNVTCTLKISNIGIYLKNNTYNLGDVLPYEMFIANFSLMTKNVSSGIYDAKIFLNYSNDFKEYSLEFPIKLKISDVGIISVNKLSDRLSSIDSVILGCYATLKSKDMDEIIIEIVNKGNNIIENVSFDILSPNPKIEIHNLPRYEKINETTITNSTDGCIVSFISDTPVIHPNDSKVISPKIVVKNADSGIYNLLFRLNFSNEGESHVEEMPLPIAIYNISGNADFKTDSNKNESNITISSKFNVVTPHYDKFEIDSGFSIDSINIPNNITQIKESIEGIIKKMFPSFVNNSILKVQKGKWLNDYLSNTISAEKRKIWLSLLKNSGKHIGEYIGSILIQRSIMEILQKGDFNPAVNLESIILATNKGMEYGSNLFKDIFADKNFIDDNFVKNHLSEIKLSAAGNKLDNVSVGKGKLEDLTNQLPIEIVEISDGNTTYSDITSGNIIVDKLPMIIKVNLTDFISQYNIIKNSIEGSFVISFSNLFRQYSGYVENNVLIITLNGLESGKWNGVVLVRGNYISADGMLSTINGVSGSIEFNVTDKYGKMKFDSLDDYLSPSEFKKMNNDSSYTKNIFVVNATNQPMKISEINFNKKMNLTDDLTKLRIVSMEYDGSSNTTLLQIIIESKKDFDNVSIIVNTSTLDKKYSEWVIHESVEKNIGRVEKNVSYLANISLSGKYGTDFNKIDVDVTHHSVLAVIGTIITIITTADWVISKTPTGKTDINFKKPMPANYKIYVGDSVKIDFNIEYWFENSWWDWDESMFFEYVVLFDGKILANERLPKNGWIDDEDAYANLKREVSIAASKFICSGDNKHKVKIIAMIFDDDDEWNPDETTYPHHNYYHEWGIWDVPPKHRWINLMKLPDGEYDRRDSMTLEILNPYYITDIQQKNERDHHTDEKVFISFKAVMNRVWQRGAYQVRVPDEAKIDVEPLQDKDGWDFEPSSAFSFKWHPSRGYEERDIKFEGIHSQPKCHAPNTAYYSDQYSLKASGKNKYDTSTGKEEFSWEVLFRVGRDSNDCLPKTYNAECRDKHPIEDKKPPETRKEVGKPSLEDGYYITPDTPIWLNATDNSSGVNYIHYEIWWDMDEDFIIDTLLINETNYTDSLKIHVPRYYTSEGIVFANVGGLVEIKWHAKDNAGNEEEVHIQQHYVEME